MPDFNPDKNLFSVAPIGSIVVIGRSNALKGGITRDYAINLLGWLVIATGATPEEISACLTDAVTKTPQGLTPRCTIPQVAPSINPKTATSVAPEVVGQVSRFIGEIDVEEAEAIKAAMPQAGKPVIRQQVPPPPSIQVKPVSPETLSPWKGLRKG